LYAWTDVEGVYRGDTTFIADVNADRVMVPDLFCSQVGTVELMPVYVKAKGTQTNYLSKALWYILNSIFPSQRDNDNVLAKKVKFVKNFGNKKELGEYTNLDMVAKIDYWKGKVLRVVYLREGHAANKPSDWGHHGRRVKGREVPRRTPAGRLVSVIINNV